MLERFDLSDWTNRSNAGAPFRSKGGDKDRRAFMDAKVSIDMGVIQELEAKTSIEPSGLWWLTANVVQAVGPAQVAFLFMAMDQLDYEELWDRFFEEAPYGTYSIYVHQAAKEEDAGQRGGLRGGADGAGGGRRLPLERFGAVAVPRVDTSWCALLGGEIAMLVAAIRDPRNQQFVFLSHSTVPLKGFGYVYRQLAEVSPLTSKFCFAEPAQYRFSTTETVRNELRRQCIFRDFYRALNPRTLKHHQWVVLAREHAQAVVRHAKEGLLIWREAWEAAAPDVAGMGEGCSDEAVPATALLHDIKVSGRSTGNTWADLTRIGVEQTCLTYVLWRHCYGGTELDWSEPITRELRTLVEHGDIRMLTDKDFNFYRSALKRELNGYPAVIDSVSIVYLRKLVQSGFMFARKFARDAPVMTEHGRVPLTQVLPELWAQVDEVASSQRMWSRLESSGAPRPI